MGRSLWEQNLATVMSVTSKRLQPLMIALSSGVRGSDVSLVGFQQSLIVCSNQCRLKDPAAVTLAPTTAIQQLPSGWVGGDSGDEGEEIMRPDVMPADGVAVEGYRV